MNKSFYRLLCTPFADIALLLLNRKKRQCDKSQILKCQMSKTFTLFTVYFRHTILSDKNTYNCGSESGTVQQATGNVSLSTQQWMVAFSYLGYREE